MPWIEGIGDEVTLFFSVVFFLSILIAAWFSTGIRDIPFISVIIVQLTRRRRANQEQSDSTNIEPTAAISEENQVTGESTTVSQEGENINDSDELEVETVQGACDVIPDASQTNAETKTNEADRIPEADNGSSALDNLESVDDVPENLTSEELRKRRLDFLSGKVPACDISNQDENEVCTDEANETPVQSDSVHRTNSQVNQGETATNSSNDTQKSGATKRSASVVTGEREQSEEAGAIQVKIKFLNDTHRQVDANLNETIGSFRRRNFSEEISESKLVRFIYNGQDLRNDASTLQSYNIGNNSVLHCLITQPRQEEHPNAGNIDENGLDIGVLMFPLFGLLLSIVWYLRFTYRQIFNVTSTLTLGGITFLYIAAFLSSFRAHRVHEHVD